MEKSPDAFRTISEVAESLETPAHVLRFWESRFPQIRPVKRAGGRRYYRPADVALLSGIRHLLHDEGMTIRGVQKILREQGVRHVASMAIGADAVAFDLDDEDLLEGGATEPADQGPEDVETAQVYALETVLRRPYLMPDTEAEVFAFPAGTEIPDSADEIATPTLRPTKPTPPMAEAPEAGHIWVEDEPELSLGDPAPLFSSRSGAAKPVEPESHPVSAHHASGIAARLRALPRPVSAKTVADLNELHSRLGLLQAQMVEALRLRR